MKYITSSICQAQSNRKECFVKIPIPAHWKSTPKAISRNLNFLHPTLLKTTPRHGLCRSLFFNNKTPQLSIQLLEIIKEKQSFEPVSLLLFPIKAVRREKYECYKTYISKSDKLWSSDVWLKSPGTYMYKTGLYVREYTFFNLAYNLFPLFAYI